MRHKNKLNNYGFTLIELMVVIAIISFLSSIVLSSVSQARSKAKDAAIITQMKQLEILFNLEYNANKSYANLQKTNAVGWIDAASSCGSAFSGTYATNATQICQNIINDVSLTGSLFYCDTSGDKDQNYSAMALLSTGKYYCVGTSGNSSVDAGTWTSTGCWGNP